MQHEVKPFQGLLLGLFFMSVGMGVNLACAGRRLARVLAPALVIMVLKTALVFAAARLNALEDAGRDAARLPAGQGSEFTLVSSACRQLSARCRRRWASVLSPPSPLTLVAAPIWTSLGIHIARRWPNAPKPDAVAHGRPRSESPVLVFGMTEEGRFAVDALRDHDIPYVAIDNDPERFVSAASDGYDVVYGDARDRA